LPIAVHELEIFIKSKMITPLKSSVRVLVF